MNALNEHLTGMRPELTHAPLLVFKANRLVEKAERMMPGNTREGVSFKGEKGPIITVAEVAPASRVSLVFDWRQSGGLPDQTRLDVSYDADRVQAYVEETTDGRGSVLRKGTRGDVVAAYDLVNPLTEYDRLDPYGRRIKDAESDRGYAYLLRTEVMRLQGLSGKTELEEGQPLVLEVFHPTDSGVDVVGIGAHPPQVDTTFLTYNGIFMTLQPHPDSRLLVAKHVSTREADVFVADSLRSGHYGKALRDVLTRANADSFTAPEGWQRPSYPLIDDIPKY